MAKNNEKVYVEKTLAHEGATCLLRSRPLLCVDVVVFVSLLNALLLYTRWEALSSRALLSKMKMSLSVKVPPKGGPCYLGLLISLECIFKYGNHMLDVVFNVFGEISQMTRIDEHNFHGIHANSRRLAVGEKGNQCVNWRHVRKTERSV